jgi:hypothetical protein
MRTEKQLVYVYTIRFAIVYRQRLQLRRTLPQSRQKCLIFNADVIQRAGRQVFRLHFQ